MWCLHILRVFAVKSLKLFWGFSVLNWSGISPSLLCFLPHALLSYSMPTRNKCQSETQMCVCVKERECVSPCVLRDVVLKHTGESADRKNTCFMMSDGEKPSPDPPHVSHRSLQSHHSLPDLWQLNILFGIPLALIHENKYDIEKTEFRLFY